MTTEETELTFVRCPNCRSLIPAIATRCRMCGAQFEKKNEAGEPAAPQDTGAGQRQSRVRQRTISASPEEVEQIKREAYADNGVDEGGSPPESTFRLGGAPRHESIAAPHRFEEPEAQEEEPRAYTEEPGESDYLMEDVTATNVRQVEEPEDVPAQEPERPEFRFVDQAQEQVHEEEWSEDADFGSEDEAAGDETAGDDDDEELGPEDDLGSGAAPSRPEGKRRRRRRRKKRGGAQQAGETQVRSETNAGGSMSTGQQNYGASQQRQEPTRNEAPRQQEARRDSEQSGGRGPVESTRSDGELAGWLAVFANSPQGESIELRAGKFFVGRQKLRATDMIISDSSVSTPHCMITIGGAEGLVVQDLMSEQGTHIRRAGSDSYSPLLSPTAVHHGDWLRFGHYEVLVCLLPKGRAS